MKLLDDQRKGIEHLKDWKVGALFMEAGTGKTRVACDLISMVPDVDLVLWIGPLQTIRPKDGLKPISEEVEKWTENSSIFQFVGVESISASDRIFLETYNLVKNARKPFIVVDESLKIKNAEAKRTKRIIQLGQMVEYKLILNGTPLSRSLLDLWSQMEFLSPKILNMTFSQFKNTFCKYTTVTKRSGFRSFSREYITGYENVDYLYSLIRHYVFQCDLSLNISQNYKELNYHLSDESADEYHRIKDKFLTDEMLIFKNNNIFFEMTQMMQHAYCIDQEKFDLVDELFKEIPEDKTIIFCKYINSREECEKRYPKAQVLSYQKEAFGLNLQEYNHTIYFDKIWDLALRVQSGRRTFRTGQEQNCYYYDLTGNAGLEYMIDRNIDKKITMSEYFKKVSIEDLKKDLA